MCGIVGLHLRDESLYPRLGELLTPMLVAMGERGPDSAGIALYDDEKNSFFTPFFYQELNRN